MTDKYTEQIIEKKKKFMVPCVYHFYKEPMVIQKGQMQYLYDHKGKQYLDMYSGVSVVNCGHANAFITEKVIEQLQTLGHTTTIYLTEPTIKLAQSLTEITPKSLDKVFFVNSGTEANEGALLTASLYNKRGEFIALTRSLHGRTKLTMSLTGLSFWRTDERPVGGISFLKSPYCFRCQYDYPSCDLRCADELEDIIKTQTSGFPCAFIAEPIQGNGGIITPPKDYFKRIKEILNNYNMLLIFDEVQTGFCRTGYFFASEFFDVVPDIMTTAKALGNGLPIGAFITTNEISSAYTRPGASTTGGNPVSAAAGLSVIEFMKHENLAAKTQENGRFFKERLLMMKEKFSAIADVRGLGLMIGAELINTDNTPAPELTDYVLEKMKDYGYLIGKTGDLRNVLTFMPPLVISKEDIEKACDTLERVLDEIL